MKVNNGNQGPIRPDRARDPRPVTPAGSSPAQKATPSRLERVDRVEISSAGRARAERLDPVAPGQADRIAQIRQRVLQGAYDADGVVGEVARRILDRGDL